MTTTTNWYMEMLRTQASDNAGEVEGNAIHIIVLAMCPLFHVSQ